MKSNLVKARSLSEIMADAKEFTKFYCSPWLRERTINMIFAPTGAGKSHWAFNLALSIAGGRIWMNQHCNKAKVLYIDGEMGGDTWLDRLPPQSFNGDVEENLKLICPEDFKDGYVKNLAVLENHKFWKEQAKEYDIIFIDNYITTCQPTAKESDIEIFLKVKDLLVQWKIEGKSVVLVHHTNKGGMDQHGTVYKDVIMDTIFRLKPFPVQSLEKGMTWEMRIMKDRNYFFKGKSEYLMDIVFGSDLIHTTEREIDRERFYILSDMVNRGFSNLEIQQKLEISGLKQREIMSRFKVDEGDWI